MYIKERPYNNEGDDMVHYSYWADNGHFPEPSVLLHLLYIQMAFEENHFPEAHHILDVASYAENDFHNVCQNL